VSINYTQLSRVVAHALRHQPYIYELELDEEGWVQAEDLLIALRQERRDWRDLNEADLAEMIQRATKRRYELANGRIRALYGHSTVAKIAKTPAAPPAILYHGTTDQVLKIILADGLKPMNRQYVHFSIDRDMAGEVAQRKAGNVIILEILAGQAHQNGIVFYEGNERVWLADVVPPTYIKAPKTD
jgi:putative RNA 2'-phosphotransferase